MDDMLFILGTVLGIGREYLNDLRLWELGYVKRTLRPQAWQGQPVSAILHSQLNLIELHKCARNIHKLQLQKRILEPLLFLKKFGLLDLCAPGNYNSH